MIWPLRKWKGKDRYVEERLRKQINLSHRLHYGDHLEIADVKETIYVINCAGIKKGKQLITCKPTSDKVPKGTPASGNFFSLKVSKFNSIL